MTSTPWTKTLCELSEYGSDEMEICLFVAGGFDNARDTLNRDQWEGTEEDREEFARLAINSMNPENTASERALAIFKKHGVTF